MNKSLPLDDEFLAFRCFWNIRFIGFLSSWSTSLAFEEGKMGGMKERKIVRPLPQQGALILILLKAEDRNTVYSKWKIIYTVYCVYIYSPIFQGIVDLENLLMLYAWT